MKRTLTLVLVVVMVAALLASCAPAEPAESEAPAATPEAPAAATSEAPAATPEATPTPVTDVAETTESYPGAQGKKVTVLLKDLTNYVWLQAADGGKAAADAFGMEYEAVAPVESNNNDEQIQLIQQTIAKGTDIMVVCPADSTGIVPAVTELNNANIPVINLNTKINNDSGTANSEAFVVADNIECATLACTELAELAGEEGEILILQGPSGGQVTIDLTAGAEQTFANYPNMEIVDIQGANFTRTEAYSVTQNMLQTYPDLKVVFACNDEMALGALTAIEEAGRADEMFVAGIDGNLDAQQSISEGGLDVTVYKNFWLQCYTAVEAAAMFLDGRELSEIIPVQMTALTADNIEEFLVAEAEKEAAKAAA